MVLLAMLPIMLFTACSSDNDEEVWTISESNIELNSKEEITISSNQNVTWKSDNPLIASVNDKGRVLALLVGKTKLIATNGIQTKEVNVTVKGNYTHITEPFLNFKDSYSDIQGYEKREKYMYSTEEELIYWGETNSIVDNVRYIFKNGKLSSCVLITHYSNYESALNYLKERYVPIKTEDGIIYLSSPDGKIAVGLTVLLSSKIAIRKYTTNKFLCVMYVGGE